ncbi:flagellar basal-body MS-ring/collar protein FliF [Candidatus Nitrotoga sp. 1052]|uniref:flagellar basal-body MS-ring/collar protein FliF n=1 Tax=Candidatus Nitrotoga sp. 1052 TaxID=2886964 RepID=UPI001EF64C77|nr:flagellar basal-body MS-ring/collar protein FliF [Candidatus Nitrotoga sp. 1052]CAH1073814.1 flagellar basal-body MS-ring and collar protein [Candidatus Nitrotoga sp. 1052]
MAEQNLTPTLMQSLAGFNSKQSIGLLVAAAAMAALLFGMWMWGKTPDYRVLYGNLSDRDGGAIIESLQQMNVPYKFAEGGGALLVPADQVHEVRLRMASQGLPKGSLVGFELMENQKFGTSQFLEQMNYQRALEGELARSVQTLASVQSARVHLAIPKPTVFVKEQQQPGASVVLTLHPGRTLDGSQISGIVHLISSSVPNMPAKNVTVVDQSGALLSSAKEGSNGQMDATQISYVRQIEQAYINRIEAIIAPLIGANNVRAQVTADVDFAQTEQTAESYKPNQDPKESTLRSQQTMASTNAGGQNASGVPGALSNQPPVPATAPIVAPSSAVAVATGGVTSSLKESTVNYEVDRTIRHTKLPVGSIKRLSVAVVLNNRTVTDKNGKKSSKPLNDSEKEQITALVKDAMGFNVSRGDSLNVLNSAFNVEKETITPEEPFWKQPEMIALAKDLLKYLLIAGIGLYLLFGVIRPAFRNFSATSAAAVASKTNNVPQAAAQERSAAQYAVQQANNSYENNLEIAKKIAGQDPKIVASVVQEWVNSNE